MRNKQIFRVSFIVSIALLLCGQNVFAYIINESNNIQMEVHYDYIEDGELKGGIEIVALDTVQMTKEVYQVAASWAVTTIRDNGSPNNRVNIVTLGDGYTADELDAYASQVNTNINGYFNQEPLKTYANYFNVYRVDVISNESGIGEEEKDTALGMWYNTVTRILEIDYNEAINVASAAPETDTVLALANSSVYGGAGYGGEGHIGVATIPGSNSSSVDLALHEFGHSFALLKDEYFSSSGTDVYTDPEPTTWVNASTYITSEMESLQTKWYRWLDHPEVDTFEGAKTFEYGLYRPTDDSKMRSLDRPFGPVNSEQIIFNIYEHVSPIDDATAGSTSPLPGDTEFYVIPLEPVGHSLDVQWAINGVNVSDATDVTFRPDSVSLTSGIYELSVTVTDNTTMVRNENKRSSLMTVTRSWTFEAVVNEEVTADINGDKWVDLADFALFALYWLDTDCTDVPACGGADLTGDGNVLFDDFLSMADAWLDYYEVFIAKVEFDDSMVDTAGLHPVVPQNGASITNVSGEFIIGTGALELDGVNDYVRIDGLCSDMVEQDYTFTAWVKSRSHDSAQYLMSINTSTSGNRLRIGNKSGNTNLRIYDSSWRDTSTPVFDEQWHFVAFSMLDSNGQAKVYVDGALIYS
ncbi:MAG TPA: hypothetical protein ENK70_09320, partial [Methylophaga sp.]|nr:hypothetical protein [Methylophaga sp.]